MKYWDELDLTSIKFKENTSRKKGRITYIRTEAAFDIETTSTYVDGKEVGFMYVWMLGIGYGEDVYYGRTWEEFVMFLDNVSKELELDDQRRLIVYSHNLSYEFQFMRKYLDWREGFNLDKRKPLKAITANGIEFRDSYILTGYSLEDTAKNLVYHKEEKLVGSLDYDKIRHSETPLTEEELAYCKADIDILNAYINEELIEYNNMDLVPLTNTARVRKLVRDRMQGRTAEGRNENKRYKHQKMMEDLTLDVKEYKLLQKAFQGGFVHANPTWVGEEMEGATGIDLASAYPAVMLSEKFPMGRGKEINIETREELEDLMEKYNVLVRIRFNGIKSSIRQENYISESKCDNLVNHYTNNGRVHKADSLEMVLTEVDYKIIRASYTWETLQIADVIYYPSGYLPKDFMETILELYEDKTKLKDVKGKERVYLHSKGMLNSTFGMTATNIIRDKVSYRNEWKTESPLVKEELKAYNESKSRFLFYPWGVWITAYARMNLWSGILHFGDDYLYADTDGIKLMNYEKYESYINNYNDLNRRKLERMCLLNNIDPERLAPKTKEGVPVLLGAWEFDGYFDKFKTLGAKRYMVQKGSDVELTVAGVGKASAKEYIMKECDGDIDKAMKMFNNELVIPKEYSGNLTHLYIDEEVDVEVVDYKGISSRVNPRSGIHLSPTDFSLSEGSAIITFIDMLKEGLILEGVDTYNE